MEAGIVIGALGLVGGFAVNALLTFYKAGQLDQKVTASAVEIQRNAESISGIRQQFQATNLSETSAMARMETVVSRMETTVDELQHSLRNGLPAKITEVSQAIALINQRCAMNHGVSRSEEE